MRNLALALAMSLAGITAASCHRLIGPAGPPYTLTGIVTSVEPTALLVRHKTGQQVRIDVAPSTLISTKGRSASLADVAVGMRIVVVYHFVNGAAVADAVRLFRPPVKAAITSGAWDASRRRISTIAADGTTPALES